MIRKFLQIEAASGIILAACTVLALTIANGPLNEGYMHWLHAPALGLSIHNWINDGLMAIFFFSVGMEIKRELLEGELSSVPKAALPILAALGGMILPALIYRCFNPSAPTAHGWGIPMATDIAFAVGVLSLFGRRVPLALKVFLLALAIADDLGAVLVIAVFYTERIFPLYLAGAAVIFGGVAYGWRRGWALVQIPLAIAAWYCFLRSGVHATIAGVILGLLVPLQPLHAVVRALHPYVNFLIMPIFALANAGVSLHGIELSHPVTLGIICGLAAGKPIGIFLFSLLGVLTRVAELPRGVSWGQIFAVGIIGGIGFTMALFISGLALPEEMQMYAKTGILGASLLTAGVGALALAISLRRA